MYKGYDTLPLHKFLPAWCQTSQPASQLNGPFFFRKLMMLGLKVGCYSPNTPTINKTCSIVILRVGTWPPKHWSTRMFGSLRVFTHLMKFPFLPPLHSTCLFSVVALLTSGRGLLPASKKERRRSVRLRA